MALSNRDQAILDFLFDPSAEKPTIAEETTTDETLICGFRFGCNAKKGSLAQEQRAVAAAESGRVEEALQLLCDVIKDDEEYASAYNNRAQLYRVRNKDGDVERAAADLEKGIELVRRGVASQAAAKQLFAQRGFSRLATAETEAKGSDEQKAMEEAARQDLEIAGKLGSEIAMKTAAKLNPYAKLCGEMVTMMLGKEKQPSSTETEDAEDSDQ